VDHVPRRPQEVEHGGVALVVVAQEPEPIRNHRAGVVSGDGGERAVVRLPECEHNGPDYGDGRVEEAEDENPDVRQLESHVVILHPLVGPLQLQRQQQEEGEEAEHRELVRRFV
jgi:hypothetical protein